MPYLLDTVTLSAFRRGGRTPEAVLKWAESVDESCYFVSVISLNEILYGIRAVERRDPNFSRKLMQWYESLVIPEQYIQLDVNRAIAELAAEFRAEHQTSLADSLIAATAALNDLIVATRNTDDFMKTGIRLVNPWDETEGE